MAGFDYSRDPLLTANIRNAFLRGVAEVLEETEEGIFIYDREDALYILYAPVETGKVWLRKHEARGYDCMVLYDDGLIAFAAERYALHIDDKCRQVVWTKPKAPEIVEKLGVRTANEEDGPLCFQIYRGSPDVRQAITDGKVLLGYEGEELAGMVGIHGEGSIGMLVVLPPFRRKGYGAELEKRLIARQLSEGFIPFVHVYLSNAASLALQTSIGMDVSEGTLTWLWQE